MILCYFIGARIEIAVLLQCRTNDDKVLDGVGLPAYKVGLRLRDLAFRGQTELVGGINSI